MSGVRRVKKGKVSWLTMNISSVKWQKQRELKTELYGKTSSDNLSDETMIESASTQVQNNLEKYS